MSHGLTLLAIKQTDGSETLGVKTPQGILDVAAAGLALGMMAPLTLEAMLATNGASAVATLVETAAQSPKAAEALFDEDAITFGRPVHQSRQDHLRRPELPGARRRGRHGDPGAADPVQQVQQHARRPPRHHQAAVARRVDQVRLRDGAADRDRQGGPRRFGGRRARLRGRLLRRSGFLRPRPAAGEGVAMDGRQDPRQVRADRTLLRLRRPRRRSQRPRRSRPASTARSGSRPTPRSSSSTRRRSSPTPPSCSRWSQATSSSPARRRA